MGNLNVRRAQMRDYPCLSNLWDECFPEDVDFRLFFFKELYDMRFAYICEADGEVCAMLHAFPFSFKSPHGGLSSKYIYGVGTGLDYRGIGAASKLLDHVARDCDFLVLIPQNEGLFDFYKKNGYDTEFYIDRKTFQPKGKMNLKAASVSDISLLDRIYESFTDGSVHPIRPHRHWEITMAELSSSGGGIYLFDGGYCAYYKDGERTIISEIFPRADSVIQSVAGAFGGTCTVLLPGSGQPFGVVRILSEHARTVFNSDAYKYLNLMHN